MSFPISITVSGDFPFANFPTFKLIALNGSSGTYEISSTPDGWVATISATSPPAADVDVLPVLNYQGTVVIYMMDTLNQVYAFQFVWNVPSNYFNYGYWGWPKEVQDCINWMNDEGETYYALNGGFYQFLPPESSADSYAVAVDMTTGTATGTIVFTATGR